MHHAMRERTPGSSIGFTLTIVVVIAATYLILTKIAERFTRL